jgi:phosphate-selective porin OprO/OprP
MFFKKLSSSLLVALMTTSLFAKVMPDIAVHGQLALDYLGHIQKQTGSTLTNGASLRAADLYVSANFNDSISANLEFGFSPDGVELGTAFIAFENLLPMTDVLLGQVPSPFCLENANSGKYLPFLERSLATAFKPCIGPGISVNHHQDSWAIKMAVKGTPLGHKKADGKKYSESHTDHYGVTVRGTWAPVLEDKMLVHTGLSFSYQSMAGEGLDNLTSFSVSEVKGRNTAKIASKLSVPLKDYMVFGLEASPAYGPFQLEAESLLAVANIRDISGLAALGFNKTQILQAHNIGANWVITGQSRSYSVKDGSFGAIKRDEVGDFGIWQLGVRYSRLDLSGNKEKDTPKTVADNLTFALNWYPTEYLRLGMNYVMSMMSDNMKAYSGTDAPEGTLALRVQTVF